MKKAVFLDRDGVLNRNVWNAAACAYESPLRVEDFELLPGVIPALQLMSASGYLLFLVSNQPNVAKGKASMQTLNDIHTSLELQLAAADISFAAHYYCFHHPGFTGPCACRKPSPHFLFLAAKEFGLDLERCWMVGDRATDIQCGNSAGVRTVEINDASGSRIGATRVASDLWSAARSITKN